MGCADAPGGDIASTSKTVETPSPVAISLIAFLPDFGTIFWVAYDRAGSKESGLPDPNRMADPSQRCGGDLVQGHDKAIRYLQWARLWEGSCTNSVARINW